MEQGSRNTDHRLVKIIVLVIIFFLFLPAKTEAKTILPVPYTSQAPHANWSQPWQDACEEASILMVNQYYLKPGHYRLKKSTAKIQLLEIFKTKKKFFKESLDENAEKIVNMINRFYNWEAKIVSNPNLEMIKEEIDNGRPVILPLYGKALKNKHFRNGGPDYHVLVVSGYDDEKKEFITEEPGLNTLGVDFRYKYDTIMNAIHDFTTRGKTKFGPKVAIFTSPEPNEIVF